MPWSVSELEPYFAAQLNAAGWTRSGSAAQGAVAWSLWQVPGEGNWQSLLYVAEGPGQKSRWLHVPVEAGRLAEGFDKLGYVPTERVGAGEGNFPQDALRPKPVLQGRKADLVENTDGNPVAPLV